MSNSAASATNNTLIPKSSATATSPQHKNLPTPFDFRDSEILERVYLTHVNDDKSCDTKIIFELVSSVVLQRTKQITVTNFKPEFLTLKLISCQMITTRGAAHCVHQTTLLILQNLRSYSWDAKVFITLAAFTLEYGNHLHLTRLATTDVLGNSLRQLNQVQARNVSFDQITDLVKYIVTDLLQHLIDWATLTSDCYKYDSEDVSALTDASKEIPVFVYWIIASVVASTGNLVGVSDYTLSEYRKKLSGIEEKLVVHLNECRQQIDHMDDFDNRIKRFDSPKDIVDLLKALIDHDGTNSPLIYEGNSLVKAGLEVFKQNNVLLFISSLNRIDDEISLLNSLYERLQEKSKIKDCKKEYFKILWIPIVTEWDDNQKQYFKTCKNKIKWHSVEYFSELPGQKIITDENKIGYDPTLATPIIPVFDPRGFKTNKNAMDLIFQWGIEAFPFSKEDGIYLDHKWKWLWQILKKAIPGLQVKKDRYIFIYGGTSQWIQQFTTELDKIKRHDSTKRADVLIENYQLGKDDPNSVPSFWIGIERKKQNKKHEEKIDCEIQRTVKNLFCLRRDPQGWIILSKGHHIKLLGHGEPAYQTAAEFSNWKDKILQKEGFDTAFKEYYDSKIKEISGREPCEIINVDTYSTSNVIATISCPNPMCGRVMEVSSVHYKCCHRDGDDESN